MVEPLEWVFRLCRHSDFGGRGLEADMGVIKATESSDWRKWKRRQAPRQVVPEGATISIELEFDDETRWPAQCLDISLTGILVEFPAQHVPHVHVERKVLLTLILKGEVAGKVPGIVRHSTERRMGILFPEASTRTVEQEVRLSHIVRTVEREVLRQKTHGAFE